MTPHEMAAALTRTARGLLFPDTYCDECGTVAHRAVQDAQARRWLGRGCPTFCSEACIAARDEREQNAEGAS